MMSKMILLVAGVLGLVGLGSAQLVQVGQCETINYMENFVLASFIGTTGTWYEVGKTANQVDDCSRLEFGTGTTVVTLSNPSVVNNFAQTATGTATYTTGTPRFTLTLTSSNDPIDFWILNTDYTNYAIAMNCVNLSATQRSINIWQLGRAANSFETPATLTAANAALSAIDVTINQLNGVDHSADACTVLPVIGAGQPVILGGQCSTTTPVAQNFDVAQFVGTWYEISSYYSENAVGTCARADYNLVGSTVNVVNSQVLNGRLDSITGTATLIGTNQEGRLSVVLNVNGVPVTQELLILDTNYNGYAVSYSCVNLANNQRRVNSWILSRTQTISAASETEVNRVINSLLDLNTAYFQDTDQSDAGCFYYPEFTPGVPVVFPGQCDQNIPVQANFDPTAYVGLWHDIESYPSTFQQGTCNNAFYTLTPQGTVDVFNTQVVEQRLDTIRGEAIIPDPTEPAKLLVSFPVAGTDQTTSTNYWVLSTDYTSYSLVYTCVNLPNNQRNVLSWKLGRTKAPFSAAANTAMNAVINSIDVLDSQYFANRDQTAAGCFYFPEPVTGQPVIFPGQCDDTVAAVPNFNLNQFIGTWHEIQTYPKEQQSGTCVNHAFSTSTAANTLNLVSNQVINQLLSSANGNVVTESTDGSGRLRLTMTVNGVVINFPYWVLATDYTSYALVYSCMNGLDDTRAVYSWKLSRTQTLPEAANTPINNAISAVQVLDNQYYEPVDQSAAGCFYYPHFQPGVPVVFPGQCNENIPVQANFDPTRYVGLWHDIESYPSTFQQGTCNNAFYTLTPQGTVDVFNTQVVGQRLDTIRGEAIIPDPTEPAKLLVTFPVAGTDLTVSTNYWVLSTDYTSYSLVYTCENLPNNQRNVLSWKLGRTKAAFSAAANTAMNAVINTVDVLDIRYYDNRDQSAAGCFYFPEPVTGQPVIFPGQCDDTVAAIPNFNLNQFIGTWHEIQTYPKEQQSGTCVNHAFSTSTAANTLNLVSNQVISQALSSANGNVVTESTDGSGRLRLTMTVNGVAINFPYWVLATDYTSYALVYSCMNRQDDTRAVYSWKLSRTQTLPEAANTPINNAISAVQVLDNQYFEPVDQSTAGCFYYPVFQPGVPVVFPGQCNENIPVQANFDPTRYVGLWHDIESYPSTFQQGTCNNAFYTLTPQGTVDVFNTQVVGQRLDTIRGEAIIPNPTEPAKLLVTFPVAGTDMTVSTNYWVLSTDYTSYSLVYTCENLPNNQRNVLSWKLGRTKAAFSAAANTAMNAVINTVDVLDSRYFDNRDQSAAGCFYFPEPVAGQPVIFPGQCDDTVAAVPNFNLNQFIGTWHEVQTYPKEQQSGTCVNHAFSTSTAANTLNLVSNQVISQALSSANGNVVTESTDGSGRLLLTMTVNGVSISFPYWVLATDYTSYALVYSCMNRQDDTRAVYSWKLSRTQTLPEAANPPIDNAISAVQVLNNQYYEPVDQSAAGCFYYPVFQPGVPVVFPGQCNENIPVQANFDPTMYVGLWHDIESYPSTFQQGTCNNAFYTLTPQGTVDVFNTQVVGQRLDTIRGEAIIPDPTEPAKLLVTFPVVGTDQTVSTNYWVLSTDYTSYSLVYTCVNLPNNQRNVLSWKLGRTKTAFSAAANTAMNAVINTVDVLDSRYFDNRDQSAAGCFYFPEPVTGQPVIFPGQCDNTVAAVPNFNLNQFIGTWHEIQTYPKEQQSGTCVNHAFSTSTAANTLNLVSNQVISQALSSANGNVVTESTDGSGRLRLTMTVNGVAINFPYWVLATDYTSYALVYSCMNGLDDTRAVYSWKLSRTQTLPEAANTPINNAISAVQVLDNQYYEPVDQSDAGCFYYPIFQPGVPVIFPGQCNQNIPVQANFDPTRYVGLWHDIESYPSTFQQGTCNNAFYTLTPQGTVDVFNTQVVEQRLDTMRGEAIIPDPSEPAKLLVSFPIAGTDQTTSTNYWVLSTDYTSYSLVYTCENVSENQRAVFSWKLGRTQAAFSAAANAAMNAVINTVDVLDSQYFADRDQSADGCFYFPEPEEGRPVLFPGQCDDTVAAVPNFNLNQFIGTWHEVQTYPKEQQTGSCVNHAFSASTTTNTLNLVSNQVIDQIANSASGSVAIESTDGSGRLRLTMTVNGVSINFPYWVLATDYTSYALIYSCNNNQNGTRTVYSWKLSRTQTLPDAANTPINTAITAVQVLDNQYYEPVDQSAAGCLSYPDIPAGDPVIIPGQCGTVTPVTGFNTAQFAGTWYEASRYASELQSGDCAANEFASSGNGFTLRQTIIYNERLTVVTGTATLPTDGSGVLTATLTDGAGLTYTTTLYVLDTDYSDFALLYNCENVPGSNSRQLYSWKFSRNQDGLSQAADDRIAQVIANTDGLLEYYYQPVGQTSNDCFYYPVFPAPPESIVLPGECPVISAKANFDPEAYLGHWFDVASYPIESQDGTCSRAYYSLDGGAIQIRNTMVVDEELRIQDGIARLSSGGTGLLTVTFVLENGDEVVTTYYVLETDYTSFSLVYNCRNLPDGTRQVFSWKLSRTPELTPAATAIINNIISNTQGLLEDYYDETSQSDADCFYIPDPVPGQSVLFRGACEPPVLQSGFNANQYLGWWHEMERYYSDDVPGDCISTNLIQGATGIQVIDSSVSGGNVSETTGTAVIQADGTLVITRNNVQTTSYVLSTDYTSYSLVYSCETVPTVWGDYRRVFSAKYSKLRSLSVEDNAAINATIAENRLLHQQFYEPVDQTDGACFAYRDDASEQVILPGQCDNSIPVQAGFEVSRFAGTWYQIERYPYPQVSNDGTCVGTRYTQTSSGLNVLNWEVLDGTLNTIEGTATVDEATASLNVNIPQEGQEDNSAVLRVLLTDYDNYALLYSCVNINAFQRSVGAFKVSRRRELSNDAQYAIENYMRLRQEFYPDYFLSISQSDQCEEPSSALLVKSSIIVVLVCALLQLVM